MEMSRPDRPVACGATRSVDSRVGGAAREGVRCSARGAPRELDRPPRLVPNDLIKCTFFPDLRQKQITTPRPDQSLPCLTFALFAYLLARQPCARCRKVFGRCSNTQEVLISAISIGTSFLLPSTFSLSLFRRANIPRGVPP